MKKSNYLLLFIMAFALITNYSCKKDSSTDTKYPPIVSDIVKEQNERLEKVVTTSTIKAFVQGYVFDVNGQAISNAEITDGDKTVQTDENGYFVLDLLRNSDMFKNIYCYIRY